MVKSCIRSLLKKMRGPGTGKGAEVQMYSLRSTLREMKKKGGTCSAEKRRQGETEAGRKEGRREG